MSPCPFFSCRSHLSPEECVNFPHLVTDFTPDSPDLILLMRFKGDHNLGSQEELIHRGLVDFVKSAIMELPNVPTVEFSIT